MTAISEINNRELALILWILALSIWCLSQKKVRSAFISVIKAFFGRKLFAGYLLMLLYISLILGPLYLIGFWSVAYIKTTLIWIICVAYVMLLRFSKANKENFFKNSVKDNFKILVVLEFFVNLYVFGLWIEMLLVPFSALMGGMIAIAESDIKYNDVKKLLNIFLGLMGIVLISFAIYKIFTDFGNFVTEKNFVNFTLPIILTIMFLPFVYLVALFSSYETLFIRMPFFIKDQVVLDYSKKKIIFSFGLNLKEVNAWGKHFNTLLINNKNDIEEAIIAFKKAHK